MSGHGPEEGCRCPDAPGASGRARTRSRLSAAERGHVAQEGLAAETLPGCLCEEWERVQAPPVAMHVLGQPDLDGPHLAAAQVLIARSELVLDRLPQLRGDQTAERVAGEVAEAAHAPVDVLQAAELVGGHLEPQQAPHPVAPRDR